MIYTDTIIRENINKELCRHCIHQCVCIDWWESECSTPEGEKTIDVMAESWGHNCDNYRQDK